MRGALWSYLHKMNQSAHRCHFANSSDDRVDTWVRLRGKHTLELRDPHTGTMTPAEGSHGRVKEQDITQVRLPLEPATPVFLAVSRGWHFHTDGT